MPDEHFPANDDEDKAIATRAEHENKKKGEWMHDEMVKILRGKTHHGTDPLSKVLIEFEKAKFDLKELKKEHQHEAETIKDIKEFKTIIQKTPELIEETLKMYGVFNTLAKSPTLTTEEKDKLLRTMESTYVTIGEGERALDRILEAFEKFSRAIWFNDSQLHDNIESIQNRFINDVMDVELYEKIEKERDKQYIASNGIHFGVAKKSVKDFLDTILQEYWHAGKNSWFDNETWSTLQSLAWEYKLTPTEVQRNIFGWFFHNPNSPYARHLIVDSFNRMAFTDPPEAKYNCYKYHKCSQLNLADTLRLEKTWTYTKLEIPTETVKTETVTKTETMTKTETTETTVKPENSEIVPLEKTESTTEPKDAEKLPDASVPESEAKKLARLLGLPNDGK